jgi:pectate lyase
MISIFMANRGSLTRNIALVLTFLFFNILHAQQLAFPGAEGFGRFATGGRGGTVYPVTNLNDTGKGSFRDAVSQPNRIVVFKVAGVINIKSRVSVSPNITIAGQTAPGEGITLYGNGLSFSGADNAIVRYIRIRMGINGDKGKDAVGIANGSNMIFDHLSVSWGRDETFSVSGDVSNITIQDCIISEGLFSHSAGGLIQTTGGISLLRNLYINNHTRNPKVKGINQFVNNVVYNWKVGAYILGGGSQGHSYANVTNNYFIAGPNTSAQPFTRGNENFHIYATGNFYDSNRNGRLDGAAIPKEGYTVVDWKESPFDYPAVKEFSPEKAYSYVLKNAGASLKRDNVDQRLISEIASLGKLGEIVSKEKEIPAIRVADRQARDRDDDGLPDQWEKKNGLNPNRAGDTQIDKDGDGYTSIEEYINSLATS